MTTPLAQSVRVLPEQLLIMEMPDGDMILVVERPKHPSDPYLTVRFEFVKSQKPTAIFPPLAPAQRN